MKPPSEMAGLPRDVEAAWATVSKRTGLSISPSSEEAEMGSLSCLLVPGNTDVAWSEFIAKGVTADWYHTAAARTVFARVERMMAESKGVDLITLTRELRDQSELDIVGGAGWISSLINYSQLPAMLPDYLETLANKYWRRLAIKRGLELVAAAQDEGEELETVKQLAQHHLSEVATEGSQSQPIKSMRQNVLDSIEAARPLEPGEVQQTGILTGLEELDNMMGGLIAPDFTVLAGPSGEGKTALVNTWVRHIAVASKIPVGYISLEMKAKQLTDCFFAMSAPINLTTYMRRKSTKEDMDRVLRAAERIAAAPLYIDDTKGRTAMQICATIRMMAVKYGIKLAIIDNAQLIRSSGSRNKNRSEELEDASRMLKDTCGDLNIALVVLSQVNEDGSLRGSKSFGHDADNVIGIVHEDDQSFIRIRKQRFGEASVDAAAYFDRQRVTWKNAWMAPERAENPKPSRQREKKTA